MAPMDLTEIGSTGLRRTSGFVIEEILPSLHGSRGARVYREMSENDPVVGSILFAIEKVILRLEWRIDPGSDDPEDVAAAEFVESCLTDMSDSWDATLQSILSMLTFGYSFHEIVYKRRLGPNQKDPAKKSRYADGRIGWRKFPIRAQETLWAWQFDQDGGIQGFIQMDPYAGQSSTVNLSGTGGMPSMLPLSDDPNNRQPGPKGRVLIPVEKGLLFRTTTVKNNPEGRSLLRNAYRPWFFKRRIEEIEAVGIERDLAGLPVAFVPPEYLSANASVDQQAVLSAVQQIVTNVKRNEQEGVIFPAVYDDQGHKLFDFTLMSTGGSRQFDTDKVISRYDQRIAMSVLSDFILLGHERVGSFALGSSKIDLWSMAVDAIAKSIVEVFNTHAIPRLLALNGLSPSEMPFLAYGEVAHVDLAEVSDFVQKLTAAGAIMPDERLEEYLRQVAGLPPAMERPDIDPGPTAMPAKPEAAEGVPAAAQDPEADIEAAPAGDVDEA